MDAVVGKSLFQKTAQIFFLAGIFSGCDENDLADMGGRLTAQPGDLVKEQRVSLGDSIAVLNFRFLVQDNVKILADQFPNRNFNQGVADLLHLSFLSSCFLLSANSRVL